MTRTLLVRGMIVGVVAGVLAAGFLWLFGESPLESGIAFESARAQAAGEPETVELVSRAVQRSVGLVAGVAVYGVALGGIFALVFGVAYGRLGRLSIRATATAVALGGFVSVIVVPFLKYPSNPPGTSNSATISDRTQLYLLMVIVSVAAAGGAVVLARRLTARFGSWNSSSLAAVGFVVVVATAGLAMPAVNETPDGFPATVIWQYRIASLGAQLVLWATLALLFGWLTERDLQPTARPAGISGGPQLVSSPTE